MFFSVKNILLASLILNVFLFLYFLFTKQYPPLLMVFHIVNLVILWGVVFRRLEIKKLFKTKWKEIILILLLIFIAFFVRMYKVEEITPGMYPDEITVAMWGVKLLENQSDWIPFIFYYCHPTPLIYATGLSVEIFGHSMTAIRLPTIIFGALSVGAFYVLLRLFFSPIVATVGSVMMLFQYTHVVLSRLAYEPIPSLFFQILSLIFFTLYYKTKEKLFLIGIGLSIGAGLYTYLNFRPFAALIFCFTIFLILKQNWKKFRREVVLFVAISCIAVMPLLTAFIIDPYGFSARVTDISIFSRHYSPNEFIKELGGNIYRTAAIPFIGDPNPGKNPAGSTLFDPLTILLAFVGFVYLFKSKRILFWALLIFFIPPFVSDIFSTEVIPEGHYYGLGHPNALRVSGFIVIILFAVAVALQWFYEKWGKNKIAESITLGVLLIFIIGGWNWLLYFNQAQINQVWYMYNYTFNQADIPILAKNINESEAQEIYVTKKFAENSNFHFFVDSGKKINSFTVTDSADVVEIIKKSDFTAVEITEDTLTIVNHLTSEEKMKEFITLGYRAVLINNPVTLRGRFIIFEKQHLQ